MTDNLEGRRARVYYRTSRNRLEDFAGTITEASGMSTIVRAAWGREIEVHRLLMLERGTVVGYLEAMEIDGMTARAGGGG